MIRSWISASQVGTVAEYTIVIYRYAGRDATKEYEEIHPLSLIEKELPASDHVGTLDESTVTEEWRSPPVVGKTKTPADPYEKPPLSAIINLNDFEDAASRTLTKKSWAFIAGASNDNLTRDANKNWFQKIWFRPKIMTNVGSVDARGRILGQDVDIPIFISPAGAAKMAGPDGEIALSKGAAATRIIQCISTTASYPLSEILGATPPSQPYFFQLYVNKDRSKTEALLRDVTASGKVKAIFVTVDLPVVSKREADERIKQDDQQGSPLIGVSTVGSDKKGAGLARQAGAFIDPSLSWDDLAWLRKHTPLPILLKGVQRSEDARKAMQLGCQGIVLSNHGGRALDNAPPALLTLLELHRNCPEVFGSLEILIDGGIRRGSDVVKAICLGATGVGLGRPFMYAINYGQDGVEHAVNSKLPARPPSYKLRRSSGFFFIPIGFC